MPLTDLQRQTIFDSVKSVLQRHAPPMVVSKNTNIAFELIGNVPTPYGSKKVMVPGIYFSSVVARKDMISFYFFPIYMNQDAFIHLIPASRKYLKGKSCFNFKKPEQVNEEELNALLDKGVEVWKKQGYLK